MTERQEKYWTAITALRLAKAAVSECEPTADEVKAFAGAVAEWQDEMHSLDSMMQAYRRAFDAASE